SRWLMYSAKDYARTSWPFGDSWTEQFVAPEYKCHSLPSTRHNQLSSVRYVGSGVFGDEVLTMYGGQEYTGGEDVFIRNDDNLGVFSNTTDSIIVVGGSPWTIYSTSYYQGPSICLTPSPVYSSNGDVGLYYGAWEMADLSVPNNAIASIQKGCHSKKVFTYSNN
ncbi:unnamed protein product, partial [Meganyctiphanes norvegica]